MSPVVLALLVGALLLVLLYLLRPVPPGEQEGRVLYERERSAMPEELATATLVMSEQLLRCEVPDFLVSKVDQVFLTPAGLLVPLETKTRSRPVVYPSDAVQLGVTAVLLANSDHRWSRHPVASHGYVRIVTPEGTRYRPVDLPSTPEVLDLARRRRELLAGKGAPPQPARSAAACPKCASRSRCPQPLR